MSQTLQVGGGVEATPGHEGPAVPAQPQRPWWQATWPLGWRAVGEFVAAFVVLTGIFVALGLPFARMSPDSSVARRDTDLVQWMVDRRTATLDSLSEVGSHFSETWVKIAATVIVATIMLFVWKRWLEPLLLAMSLILEASVFIVATTIVRRDRPDVPQLDGSPVASSFPSGHVAAATVYGAVAIIIFWHTRKRWPRWTAVAVCTFIALAVALARMYRGMHYLSDCVAGVALGLASLAVVTWILLRTDVGRRARAELRHAEIRHAELRHDGAT